MRAQVPSIPSASLAAMGSQVQAPRSRLPEFLAGDPIRGIGVFAVITYHCAAAALLWAGLAERHGQRLTLPDEFRRLDANVGPLIEAGGYALGLFFALSGYLIARPFVFAVVHGTPLPRISSFARNRVLRILPAFWVVFTVVLLLYGTKGASASDIASVYSFVEYANRTEFALLIGQAWSIRAEILFYVLVPITAWLLLRATRHFRAGRPQRTATVIALPLVVAGVVIWVNTWELTGQWNPTLGFHGPSVALDRFWYHMPLIVLYQFMPGVIFAALETFLPSRLERFGRLHARAAWALPTAMVLGALSVLYVLQRLDPASVPISGLLIFLSLSGLIGGPLVLQWATGGCWRALDNRLLRWVGQRSYSIYLVHLVVIFELAPRVERHLESYKETFLVLLPLVTICSVALGHLLFRAVEAPFMNLKTWSWRSAERKAVWRRAALWVPHWTFTLRRPGSAESAGIAETASGSTPSGAGVSRRLTEFLAGDPIRGIGVLAVIAYHVAHHALFWSGALETEGSFVPLGPLFGPLIETGGFALALFFALSGYLIGRPFVFALIHGEPFPRLSTYARNRILRLVPVLWAVFTVLLIIYGTKGASAGEILSVYGFLEGFAGHPFSSILGQAWSLRVEALFYVLLPASLGLLVWATRRARFGARLRTATVIVLSASVAALIIWIGSSWVHTTERSNPIIVLYIFMPGIALAALETFLPARVERFAGRHPRAAWGVPTLVALASFMVLYCVQYFDPPYVQLNGFLITIGVGGLLGAALFLQWGTGGCWRLLDNRLLRWLGQRSYSIYMVHLVIIVELAPRFANAFDDNYKQVFVALLATSIAASVLLGDVTFRLVEAPFMNLKTWSWRSSERKAVFRRAAWWLPSRAVKRIAGTKSAPPPPAAEPTPESAVGTAEPSASRMSPTGS